MKSKRVIAILLKEAKYYLFLRMMPAVVKAHTFIYVYCCIYEMATYLFSVEMASENSFEGSDVHDGISSQINFRICLCILKTQICLG